MKIFTIGSVLISLGINFVSGLFLKRGGNIMDLDIDDDDWDIEQLSTECKAEVQKSLTCLRKIETGINSKEDYFMNLNVDSVCLPMEGNTAANLDTCKKQISEGFNTICSAFTDDSCKDLMAENAVANLIKNGKCNNSEYDLIMIAKIAFVKSAYLMGCNKTKKGDLCPLAKFITSTVPEFFFNNFNTLYRLGSHNMKLLMKLILDLKWEMMLPLFYHFSIV